MNAISPIRAADLADLPALVEMARALLDEGDYRTALDLAAGVYDQAQAAAKYGEKVKANRQLIDKARRMQAEAVKIESICLCGLADTVDAAQQRGEIATRGRPKNVSGENILTLDDIGIDRGRLHQARKLRDAERAAPGFIDSVVEKRMAEGLEPSRANLRAAVGTASASKEEKGAQLYETPDVGTKTLLALESFTATVDEPACGRGAVMRILEEAGYDVRISDLHDREIVTRDGVCQDVGDFLRSTRGDGDAPDIVTNPPYGDLANKFAAHALRVHKPSKMALLLNSNFMFGFEDPDRRYVMDEQPPSRIYCFTRRLPMMHRDGWDGNEASSRMNTCWFVWERNADGSYGQGAPQIIRVDWQYWSEQPALAPEEGHRDFAEIAFVEPEDAEDFTRSTPFKPLEQRVDEERARALVWIAEQDGFDVVALRKALAVRASTAEGLVAEFSEQGVIEAVGDGAWRIGERGWMAIRATAAVVAGGVVLG